jgi:hypothetical protein
MRGCHPSHEALTSFLFLVQFLLNPADEDPVPPEGLSALPSAASTFISASPSRTSWDGSTTYPTPPGSSGATPELGSSRSGFSYGSPSYDRKYGSSSCTFQFNLGSTSTAPRSSPLIIPVSSPIHPGLTHVSHSRPLLSSTHVSPVLVLIVHWLCDASLRSALRMRIVWLFNSPRPFVSDSEHQMHTPKNLLLQLHLPTLVAKGHFRSLYQ